MSSIKKMTVMDLVKLKMEGRKIVMMTAYDYPTGLIADRVGMDVILVGDSAGMVVLGYERTAPVTLEEMLVLCKAVARGVKRALLVGDMPFMSYNITREEAVKNAGRLIKEGGVDAVKLEGGSNFKGVVKTIVDAGIPVMGHIGLTPQTASLWSGYRVQGRTSEAAMKIIEDAHALAEAGAFSIVLELVTSEVAEIISEEVGVPIIGIGSGPFCSGQVLVLHDVLGLYDRLTPKFVKQYANLTKVIQEALEAYKEDVVSERFPSADHTFHMSEDDYKRLLQDRKR